MHPPPAATTGDGQDVVNQLLAAALHARATRESVLRAAALSPADQPQAVADLTDAATVLTRVHDALLHAAGAGAPETRPR
ncbi:hypothetical protein Acy02nite_17320 [Actinoplanes cyaneus]|uniref:Uncharacterized protein n=1 Tax=Actinoplanes cyaneus TaxID=52696 RepID=A0A919IGC5_9ACTN|nr:hypothetical protein [Actinoplanes cyaneus]MCW2141992.1 hypothetical protein [Actinoplanes cyaneus]GID63851.1 hypothetical protein Acy02nite_17320 [Actinoplanes cyaneus]